MLERLLNVPDTKTGFSGGINAGDQVQSRLQQIHEALEQQKQRNESMEGDIDLRIRAEKMRLFQQQR